MTHRKSILFLTIILLFFLTDCSDRVETPSIGENSTIIFPSKSTDGIEALIIFCKGISKKTGKQIKTDTVFSMNKKEKVYSLINLVNRDLNKDKVLMFHIDWLDSTGNSLYKKRIDLASSDTTSILTSSISVSPEKRKPGKYSVRVYLFRELIAEKYFHLVKSVNNSRNIKEKELTKKKNKPEKKDENQKSVKPKVIKESLKTSIILCKKISKKTGKPIGVDTIFTIREKAKVKAIVSFEKPEIKTNEQMKFYFNWFGPDGKIFYKKRIVYTTSNPIFSLSNSISISPGKRIQGNYKIQIVYKEKIIAEKKFELALSAK
jgi:hypothetical protein